MFKSKTTSLTIASPLRSTRYGSAYTYRIRHLHGSRRPRPFFLLYRFFSFFFAFRPNRSRRNRLSNLARTLATFLSNVRKAAPRRCSAESFRRRRVVTTVFALSRLTRDVNEDVRRERLSCRKRRLNERTRCSVA